jgi:hypothetical protein
MCKALGLILSMGIGKIFEIKVNTVISRVRKMLPREIK